MLFIATANYLQTISFALKRKQNKEYVTRNYDNFSRSPTDFTENSYA